MIQKVVVLLVSGFATTLLTSMCCQGAEIDADWSARASYWTRDKLMPAVSNATSLTAWSRGTVSFGEPVSVKWEAWGSEEPMHGDNRSSGEIRKAYLAINNDTLKLRIGRQLELWGRADKLNPTDNLSARDYRLLRIEDEDQRLGVTMAKAETTLSENMTISGYWIPEFRASRFPFELVSPSINHPIDWEADQYAIRLDSSGGRVDWSLSYYSGFDHSPDYILESTGVKAAYHKIRVIGADLAGTAGGFGYRLEGAYTSTEFDRILQPLIRRPDVWVVAGIDSNYSETWYTNVQYSFRQVLEDGIGGCSGCVLIAPLVHVNEAFRFQEQNTQHGLSATLRWTSPDKNFRTELMTLRYLAPQQGLVRATIIYKPSDLVTLSLQAQSFYGEKGTYFETVQPTSGVGMEVKVGF
ncbi:conserved exported hypothetical protein [Gammaproteobacteria bacterium]